MDIFLLYIYGAIYLSWSSYHSSSLECQTYLHAKMVGSVDMAWLLGSQEIL